MITLRGAPGDEAWCTRLRTDVARQLLATGAPGLTVNVRDAAVTDSLMTLTTLEPPVIALRGFAGRFKTTSAPSTESKGASA